MSGTVLIVDDSLTVRMQLIDAFATTGLQTVPCTTAAEARVALAKGNIDLVILDVLLPDGDGIELLAEIRASAVLASVPVLMLSTEAEVHDRIRALRVGANEYVGKPYDTSYVLARSQQLVRGRTAPSHGSSAQCVLVVDDSVTFRESLCEALLAAGYDVLCATTGEEGLRMLADRRPAALIVDGMLPGIDGATVVRHVRLDAALRRTPCLLLTASDARDAELWALDAGADAFVRKDQPMGVILARLSAALRSTSTPGTEDAASMLGPKRILAVDDSETYLDVVTSALRSDGYDVVPVHSGEEALQMLAVQPVDCILLDFIMPGLSGKETCRRIKAAPFVRDIPLIMLTALETHETMLDSLSAGADDYIAKSSELEVIRARVRAQIRRKLLEDETRRIREQLLRRELDAAEARAARELAETRAALIDELERKNRELEAFSYSVSHDLRAPLRSIDGFSNQLLSKHAEQLDGVGLDSLRRVRAAAQRMGELIDDMLQLSRVSNLGLKIGQVDLSALAHTVLALLAEAEPARTVERFVHDGMVVRGDARLLRVALENLLGNAWKFTSKQVHTRIEVGAELQEGVPIYFVRDNGAGFDMEYAGKLFQPFQRLHSQRDFAGTGIGLATVQRIADRHGGRVWAHGELDRGATFYFTLPGPRVPADTGAEGRQSRL